MENYKKWFECKRLKRKHWKLIKFNLNYLSISLIKIISHKGNFIQAIQKENLILKIGLILAFFTFDPSSQYFCKQRLNLRFLWWEFFSPRWRPFLTVIRERSWNGHVTITERPGTNGQKRARTHSINQSSVNLCEEIK